MNNLQLRIMSGILLAGVVLLATFAGGVWFRLLAIGMGAGVYVEWRLITGCRPQSIPAAGAQFLLILAFASVLVPMPPMVTYTLVLTGALAAWFLSDSSEKGKWLAGGIAYAGLPAASLAYLRSDHDNGLFMVLFLFAIVWATDIFAYFVGRSIGGAKLAPAVSPGKTRSGAVGGLAAAIAAGLFVAIYAGPEGNPLLVVLIAIVSVVSQAGDLFESWVKRRFGVKDSGSIIPGHGGIMDRVDGLAVAAVALYVLDKLMRAF